MANDSITPPGQQISDAPLITQVPPPGSLNLLNISGLGASDSPSAFSANPAASPYEAYLNMPPAPFASYSGPSVMDGLPFDAKLGANGRPKKADGSDDDGVQVSVLYSDQLVEDNVTPYVRITTDGKVLNQNGQSVTAGDLSRSNLVIKVDRDPEVPNAQMTDLQKQCLNDFLKNDLTQALDKNADFASRPIYVADQTAAVDPELMAALMQPQIRDQAQVTADQITQIDNAMPAPSGIMSREQAESNFSNEVTQRQRETDDEYAVRRAVTALFSQKDHPYTSISRVSDGYMAGPGITYNVMDNYMTQVVLTPEILRELGTPPDYSKLGEVLKKHPELLQALMARLKHLQETGEISKEMAQRLSDPKTAGELGSFINKLHSGGTMTRSELAEFRAEMKANLPKETQEAIILDTVRRYMSTGADAAHIAAAIQLGKTPAELAAHPELLKTPEMRKLMAAAQKYHAVASSIHNSKPGDYLSWSTDASGLQMKIAKVAEAVAEHTGTSGWCYRAAKKTLGYFGIHLSGGKAEDAMSQMMELVREHKFEIVTGAPSKPGDVRVCMSGGSHPYGHIDIVARDGHTRAADHFLPSSFRPENLGYGEVETFRAVDPSDKQA